jgi:hypothetical protein
VLGWAALRRIAAAPAEHNNTRLEPTVVSASDAIDVPEAPGNAEDVRQWAMAVRLRGVHAAPFSSANAVGGGRCCARQASEKPGGASRADLERMMLRHQQPFLGGKGRSAPACAAQRAHSV